MKPEELMIGDLVLFNNGYQKGYERFTLESIKNVDGNIQELADCYEPILLTFKILEMNGFEYIDKCYLLTIDDVTIQIGKASMYILSLKRLPFSIDRRDIEYVHQLQHALRLCGLEDLADNFKVE